MIFDTHCHLNSPELYLEHQKYIDNALLVGVKRFLIVGYDLDSSLKAIEIAKKYPKVCCAAIGIHPSEILKCQGNDLERIEELLKEDVVKAVGEIGLDYHWDDVPKDIQKEWFEKQIKLANKYHKPIVIHTRDAAEDTYNILKVNKEYIYKGIMHCYSGSAEMVKMYTDLGMYISLGGPLTFKNARVPKEVVKVVPKDKLLFETDSPYLAPHPLRGKQNEPALITLVIKEASSLLEIDYEELASLTYKNALEVLDIHE